MSGDPSTSAEAVPPAAAAARKTPKTDNFSIIEEIGTGAYGTVYKAKNNATQDLVALKKIIVSHSSEEGMPLSTIREIAMLKQLGNVQHDNIVKLIEVVHGPKVSDTEVELNLVFEYIEQDLAMYLKRCPSPGLGRDKIKDLSQQLLTGIDFLHSNRIVHRDLKPQNILITNRGQLKVADFGLARIYGFNMALTQVVVTLWYRSPEVLLQTSYATPVDLWSVGCIFAELHTRGPLFQGKSDIDQLRKIFDVIGLPDRSEWPDDVSIPWTSFTFTLPRFFREIIYDLSPLAEDLLKSLLAFNPERRITASQALNHSYFKDDEEEEEDSDEEEEEEEEESEEEEPEEEEGGEGEDGDKGGDDKGAPGDKTTKVPEPTEPTDIPSSSTATSVSPGPSHQQTSDT